MAEQQIPYRCYYGDGSVIIDTQCPAINANGSELIASELTIIENVNTTIGWPWLLLILGLIVLTSERK